MKVYNIYHAIPGPDQFSETEDQQRLYAGHVVANSLQMAYELSQNMEAPWNYHNPCRSTSVGDVIEYDGQFHMVCNWGFRKLEEPVDEFHSDIHDYSAE